MVGCNKWSRSDVTQKTTKYETMKKGILFILALGCFYCNAQEDTTQYKLGNKKVMIITNSDADSDSEWDNFDLSDTTESVSKQFVESVGLMQIGANGYLSENNTLALPDNMSLLELDMAKSRSFSMMTSWYFGRMDASTFYISPGLGFTWNSYKFKNNINISTNNDTLSYFLDTVVNYRKYKLRATYIEVPLVVGIRLGSKTQKRVESENGNIQVRVKREQKPFNLQVGVVAGYNIGSIVKAKFERDGTRYKDRISDDYNLNPFRLAATARIGVGDFGFFANYSLTPLFEPNKSPELIPFSVGVQFNGF